MNGHVVIAAITSCTNTSNPSVLIAAGLVARKARAGSVSRSSPGSRPSLAARDRRVVTDLPDGSRAAGTDLDAMGFNLVGLWLAPPASAIPARCRSLIFPNCISDNDLVAASVLSGNRNFEGRVKPRRARPKLSGLAAAGPSLTALAGSLKRQCRETTRSAPDKNGTPVYLKGHLALQQGGLGHRAQK